ncbi:MAG: oligopeptide/dipeptide ABC transporter ATP-binding protein, partial [Desulfomonilaceae bacterium]
TEALMSNVPTTRPEFLGRRIILRGDPADPINPPSGCSFHPRCAYSKEICSVESPVLREIKPNHFASCHFAESLDLRGCDALGCVI